jgi:hypothetical protein
MATKNNLVIFDKYKKDNSHLIPFNVRKVYLGNIKYLPPVSKEWKNTIYAFNKGSAKNFPVYDRNIYSLINNYFNSFFYHKNIDNIFITRSRKRASMNKVFVSKPEIKHTNSKAIITIYTYNRQKIIIFKKLKHLRYRYWVKKKIRGKIKKIQRLFDAGKYIKSGSVKLYRRITRILRRRTRILRRRLIRNLVAARLRSILSISNLKSNRASAQRDSKNIWIMKAAYSMVLGAKSYMIKRYISKIISQFRKFKFRYNLNKYKFEEKLLYILSSLISKYYNKKVEFNIVNMKSFILNSDIFTKILTLRLKKPKSHYMRLMKFILNKAVLPKVNKNLLEKGTQLEQLRINRSTKKRKKTVDFNLLENKYLNLNIDSILRNNNNGPYLHPYPSLRMDEDMQSARYISGSLRTAKRPGYGRSALSETSVAGVRPSVRTPGGTDNTAINLDNFLNKLYYNVIFRPVAKKNNLNISYNKIYDILFNSIKYKNIGGVRLIVSGRLTKRYRADRALYKVRWKGGLKNIDASYKGLTAVNKRGYMNANVEYSLFTAKRRVGSYAVKGWISGK